MHRVFISYHHARDQAYKDTLTRWNDLFEWFEDYSVNSGDIDDTNLDDEAIRVIVRDQYLRNSSVTIVLVGLETRLRKHVDWELYSSMRDSKLNRKSGIILVPLPETNMTAGHVGHGAPEKAAVFPEVQSWTSLDRKGYEDIYPYLSSRMIDNLVQSKSQMSVIPWSRLTANIDLIPQVIDFAYDGRQASEYDTSRSMRRKNG